MGEILLFISGLIAHCCLIFGT